MEKEYLKKLFYSFLKGKEYTGKSVVVQNLSVIDKITETICENNEEIKLFGVKNTSDIDREIIQKLTKSKKFYWHTIDNAADNGRAVDINLTNPLTGRTMTGSSSGTAINVFLGINDLGIGTDGGGSVIYPALSLNLYSFTGSGAGLKSKKNKKSTDNLVFSTGIGFLAKDLETIHTAVFILQDADIISSYSDYKIAVSKELENYTIFENIKNKEFITDHFKNTDDRTELISIFQKVFEKYDILIIREELIDTAFYGDSIMGNLGKKAKEFQFLSNKRAGRVINMMNLSAVTVPSDELSSGFIIIAKTGKEYIKPLFEVAAILKSSENQLFKRYFSDFLENDSFIFE
ncbi:MAG: amidase [Fusobacteriales bacterium]|nr:amidase [Fusobacteriales bacterium]